MTQEDIYEQLQSIFDDVFLSEVKVSPELSAKEVEEWDSLLHISLVIAISEGFKIRFRAGEVEGTRNVGELVDLIQAKVA